MFCRCTSGCFYIFYFCIVNIAEHSLSMTNNGTCVGSTHAVSTCAVETEVAEETLLDEATADGWQLVLYNDEHNSFDHVIEMLVSVCGHEAAQAEQCALLVHFKGKCTVMSGAYDDLEPKCSKLLSADLTAEIEA